MKRLAAAMLLTLLLASSLLAAGGDERRAQLLEGVPNTPAVAISRDELAGLISADDAATYEAYALFEPAKLPDRYKTGVSMGPNLCLTPQLVQMRKRWNSLPDAAKSVVPRYMQPNAGQQKDYVRKGTLRALSVQVIQAPASYVKEPGPDASWSPKYDRTYATTNFLIHWMNSGPNSPADKTDSNSNGAPDMVENAGQFFETTWTWFASHGYRLPPDTTEHYYNVYFTNPGSEGWLGVTYGLTFDDHTGSFINLTNDFPTRTLSTGKVVSPTNLMRVAASHEFFHAVQFGYDAGEDPWWMEATAMWIMEQIGPAWDSVDAYTLWIKWFFVYPEVALDYNYGDLSWHWYAAGVWPLFIQAHYDPAGDSIREIWEACDGPTGAIDATRSVLSAYVAGGFDEAFKEFLVANYEGDYPEAAQFPADYGDLWYTATVYTYPTGLRTSSSRMPQGLGSNYVAMYPESGSSGINLETTFTQVTPSGSWVAILVGKNGATFDDQELTAGVAGVIEGFRMLYQEAVLIVSPMVQGDIGEYSYAYSAILSPGDVVAPQPNPMTWAAAPSAASSTSISMTATTATDTITPPVVYQFEEITGNAGGTTSAWQLSPAYSDTGLAPNTQYGYHVRAMDSSPNHNTTGWSTDAYVFTLANTPAAPTLSDPSPTKLYITISPADGNPDNTGYAVYNQTTSKYIGPGGIARATPFFMSRDEWSMTRIQGLSPATAYSFVVKARNQDNIETAFGPVGHGTTLAADTAPPAVTGISKIPTWVKQDETINVTILVSASDRTTGGSDIVAMEYFMGADPGYGNANQMIPAEGAPIFNDTEETGSFWLDTRTWRIADNPHRVHVRAKDEAGYWSQTVAYNINVVDSAAPAAVTDLAASAGAPGALAAAGLSVDSVANEDAANPAENAIDGNTTTYWATETSSTPAAATLVLDLDQNTVYSKVTLYTSDRPDLFPAKFRVKLGDGTNWNTVVSEYDYAANPGANPWQFAARKASKMIVEIEETPVDGATGFYRAEIGEIEMMRNAGDMHAVDLTWTAPSDVGPSGRATTYHVKYTTDPNDLQIAFAGETPTDTIPIPAAAGVGQGMQVSGLDPGTTYYFALKSADEYDNVSDLSNVASATTEADTEAYVVLDAPQDQESLDVSTPATFAWHANVYNTFKVQFSNVPSFPTKPFKDALGRTAQTATIAARKGSLSFTPSAAQWKTIKRMAGSMDGTLYWRLAASLAANKAVPIGYSQTFGEYGFETGTFFDVWAAPFHERGGSTAVWPNSRPQFIWGCSNPVFSVFYIDFSTSPDINIYDRKNTISIMSRNRMRTLWRPAPADWKKIKGKIAKLSGGNVWWRVRGFDADKAYSAASAPVLLIIDAPTINLRQPGPRRDGTVEPGKPFTLDWGVEGEGYNKFAVVASTSPDFIKGPQTVTLKKLQGFSYTVTAGQAAKIGAMLLKAAPGADTFYWKVIATDVDNIMSFSSEAQAVKVSVTPAGGGA